jgi:hypothetical protein
MHINSDALTKINMKLSDIASSGNRIFMGTDINGIPVTLVVRFMGKDAGPAGSGFVHRTNSEPLALWLGKMKKGSEAPFEVALAIDTSGLVVAANTDDPAGAIKDSINTRRSYGGSLRPDRNWKVKEFGGIQLQGYSE